MKSYVTIPKLGVGIGLIKNRPKYRVIFDVIDSKEINWRGVSLMVKLPFRSLYLEIPCFKLGRRPEWDAAMKARSA